MNINWLLQKGVNRLSNMARENMYLSTGFDKTKPEFIQCEVNERCNYKCQYCYCWQMPEYSQEMSIEEWQKILLGLREFLGKFTVQFYGGEPFIKKGFVSLPEFCHENDIGWGVITNGSAFTEKTVERIVAAHPTNIDISVDSPDPEINNLVRGAPQSLQKIEKGIRLLRDRRDATATKFPIRIKATVTRHNFHQLPWFAGWIKKHGADTIDFRPVHTVPFWTEQLKKQLWPSSQDISEMGPIIEQLIQQKQNGAPIETSIDSLRSLTQQFSGQLVPTSISGPCRAGMRTLAIKANGDIRSCWDFPNLGNAREDSPKNIWYGDQATQIRRDTVKCSKVGGECANSCLEHRSLTQDIKRGVMLFKSSLPKQDHI